MESNILKLMKKHIFLTFGLFVLVSIFITHNYLSATTCEAVNGAHCYYVAPSGSDANDGSFIAPFKTFKPALLRAAPGDFIYARGGTYTNANNMVISSGYDSSDVKVMIGISDYWMYSQPQFRIGNGVAGKPITIQNYPGEIPKFAADASIDHNANSILFGSLDTGKAYWTIKGFDIKDGYIGMGGGNGFGKETHDIIIEENNIHDFVNYQDGGNVGMVRIDRGDYGGAYNIFIRNNHFDKVSHYTNPGVYTGDVRDAQHMAAITTLSQQTYYGFDKGGTGYIEITGNEFLNMPQFFFFKNPMAGPVEISNNTFHDGGTLGMGAAANVHFNHNLVYNVPGGFYYVGLITYPNRTDPDMLSITGMNYVIQYNTFVGSTPLLTIASGVGHNITNNVYFGLNNRVAGAGWDNGQGYITKAYPDLESGSTTTSLLQKIHSDNNCFIIPTEDALFTSRYVEPALEFYTYKQSQRIFNYDLNSKFYIQSNPAAVFTNPSLNNYTLLDPNMCPGMGKYATGSTPVTPTPTPTPTPVPEPTPTPVPDTNPTPIPEPTPTGTTWYFGKDLKQGMTDPDVTRLQQFLIKMNRGPKAQALAKTGVSQYFGSQTKAALGEYQKKVGISPASGVFGPVTREYINKQNILIADASSGSAVATDIFNAPTPNIVSPQQSRSLLSTAGAYLAVTKMAWVEIIKSWFK